MFEGAVFAASPSLACVGKLCHDFVSTLQYLRLTSQPHPCAPQAAVMSVTALSCLALQAQAAGAQHNPKSCPIPPSPGHWHQTHLAQAASLPAPAAQGSPHHRHSSSSSPKSAQCSNTADGAALHQTYSAGAQQHWPFQPVSPGEMLLARSRQHSLAEVKQLLPSEGRVSQPGTSPGGVCESRSSAGSFGSSDSASMAEPRASTPDRHSNGQGEACEPQVPHAPPQEQGSSEQAWSTQDCDQVGHEEAAGPQLGPGALDTDSLPSVREGHALTPGLLVSGHSFASQISDPPPEGLVDPSRVFHTRPSQHAPDNPFV